MLAYQKVSEYDQKKPQSYNPDEPTAPQEETQNTDSHNTIKVNMRGPRFFLSGGGGGGVQARLPENCSDNVFFFIVLNLFYSFTVIYEWFITKKIIIFQGFRRGPTFSRGGGSNLFQVGAGGGAGGGPSSLLSLNCLPDVL